MPLNQFNSDSSIPGTLQALIYAIKMRYGVTKPYVTLENASNRLLNILISGYKVHSATYRGLSEPREMDPALSTLVIKDPRLDAFYLEIPGAYEKVVVFFDNPEELLKLHTGEDIPEVPFGSYMLQETMRGYILIPLKVANTEKPILEPGIMESLIVDTDTFFASEEFYKANKIPHKRGVLVLGAPGTGKSTFIKYYLSHVTEIFGLILDCSGLYFGPGLFQYLRSMFGKKNKVLVMEDVDSVASSMGGRSAFLNFIDGPNELHNTLIIATTNYPERLDPAILDRPSRFDTIIYIAQPGPELRKEFLLQWFPELANDESRLSSLAESTEGFTGAYFKELATLVGLRRCTAEQALDLLRQRQELLRSLGARHTAMPLYDNPPESPAMAEPMKMAASLVADYRVTPEMAKKIILLGSK